MKERIPRRIDYHRYTEQGVVLDGVITLAESQKDLSRLNAAIISNSGDINYHLDFDTDILGNRFVSGHVDARVVLQCQRCMENFELDLSCEISLAFVQNDFQQQQAEVSKYDIFWLARKELFDPRILLEDELLLALPQIPMHPESEIGKTCDVQVRFLESDEIMSDASESDETAGSGRAVTAAKQNDDNPFAILKQLKK